MAGDLSYRAGHLVGLVLEAPYRGLVRWQNAEPTLEMLEDLVGAVFAPLPDPGAAERFADMMRGGSAPHWAALD
jgi:hypothetical protein